VNGAAEALQILRSEEAKFDICLTDYHMPQKDGIDLAKAIKELDAHSSMVTALLSSGSANPASLADAGISYTLNKPIRQLELYDLIARCRDVEVHNVETPKQAQESFEGSVLLVEDNKVNQLVAQSLLEKMGLTVELVADGEKALIAMKDKDYDLVFMDCLMPIMDGYEATIKRRKIENMAELKRQTIIALTANAMSGDKEKCLEAGMDDFLSKPIKVDELQEKLRFWLTEKSVGIDTKNQLTTAEEE